MVKRIDIPIYDVLNIPVMGFPKLDVAAEYSFNRIIRREKTICFAINPEKAWYALKHPSLSGILKQAEMNICDGTGIALAIRLLHGVSVTRCTGFDLFFRVIQWAEQTKHGIFLLGAEEKINAAASNALLKKHSELIVCGRHHGFFHDDRKIITAINDSGADILFVAMGSPKQEYWIAKHRTFLHPVFIQGIGGTLDVVGGKTKKVPDSIQQLGLGFLYRLMQQPTRIKRQSALPKFVWCVIKEKISPRGDGRQ